MNDNNETNYNEPIENITYNKNNLFEDKYLAIFFLIFFKKLVTFFIRINPFITPILYHYNIFISINLIFT